MTVERGGGHWGLGDCDRATIVGSGNSIPGLDRALTIYVCIDGLVAWAGDYRVGLVGQGDIKGTGIWYCWLRRSP
ncbi:MAG: hypothetical protein R2825_20045 [Saprospiraceae bacterium]